MLEQPGISLKFGLLSTLLMLLVGVGKAVKITNLKVPATYILDSNSKNPDPLILDCEYEVDENERGFVLKWFLDDNTVYQWIPSKTPFSFQSFRNRVDVGYAVSADHLHKHRAMAIISPLTNFTGEYSCSVQTWTSMDKKSARLKIIVRESDFNLNYFMDEDENVIVFCEVKGISPKPHLMLTINNNSFNDVQPTSIKNDGGLYDVSIVGRISREDLESPSTINCLLKIPETNYTRKRSALYYEYLLKTTTTTIPTTVEDIPITKKFMDNYQKQKVTSNEGGTSSAMTPSSMSAVNAITFLVTIFISSIILF